MNRCVWSPQEHPQYAGVTVCEEWHQFEVFLSDMGERPVGKTLDRKDNDKGYDPDNCRWATSKEQAFNRSTTIVVRLDGEDICLKDAAKKAGISYRVAHYGFRRGRPISDVLGVPAGLVQGGTS